MSASSGRGSGSAARKTKKDLFDTSGTILVSRLDYNNLGIFTGEAFSRLDFNNGWFLKGYVGGGGLFGGNLKDEDFPPVTVPYSATLSNNKSGSMFYGSVDAGFKLVRGPDFHLGAFAGYHFLRDYVDATGCTQIGEQPGHLRRRHSRQRHGDLADQQLAFAACSALKGRSNSTGAGRSRSMRPGCPTPTCSGADTHLLRIGANPGDFTGPIPEDGKGWGYQFDAIVAYRVNDWVTVGAGGRYWHVEAKGHTHFEGHVVGVNAQPQVVHWRADHFGGFIQANIKFGPRPVVGGN